MAATTLIDRALLRLSGDDVRDFLQGLVTNDMALLGEGRPLWAGLLTPQGKTLFDFILWADRDDVLVDCEAGQSDALQKRLSIYRLRRPIRIEQEAGLGVHWTLVGDGQADPRLAALGSRWLAAPGEPASGWLKHRLSLGVTEGLAELGDILWLECNAAQLHGVSFSKGCYVGQENTARMNYRGKVTRRLVVLPAVSPGPRTKVFYAELGLAVEHRRLDDLKNALIPEWLAPAISPA